MSVVIQAPVTNQLLDCLPLTEQNRLLEQCETVHLVFGNVLCDRDRPFLYLYFPTTCFVSLVATLNDHRPIKLGLIGNEGMLGATLALGINSAPSRAVVQGPGSALRISAPRLRRALRDFPVLRRTVKRYLYVLMKQQTQNAACVHFHEIEPRLARWLLMIQDRAHANHFHLTHEFLADMLGVRRSGVTIAAGALQLRKLIHYSRGNITIVDREGLKLAACECYEELLKGHALFFPPHASLVPVASL